MAKQLKSAGHHWWPECVSERWKDASGCVSWILPDGEVRTAPPKNFGVIGNGHHIKLGGGTPSPWDSSFEQEFNKADDAFPGVLDWLEGLDRALVANAATAQARFLRQTVSDGQLTLLVECLVSLAVRSPRFREYAVGAAERLRGPLSEADRNPIIAMNMRHCQRMIADSIGARGKFAVLYSPNCEFVFGDGFYCTAATISTPPMSPRMLVPLTPHISVLYARPMRYSTEPKLVTAVLEEAETSLLNDTVQVYARRCLFYRNERPRLGEAYQRAVHLEYSHPSNPIENLIHMLPGVPPRDTSFDHLLERVG